MNKKNLTILTLLGLTMLIVLMSCASAEVRAVQSGDVEGLREYVAGGGDVNAPQRNGKTLLMIAAESAQLPSATFLLNNGARIGVQDNRGNNALMYAANAGSVPIVELLLSRGAQVNVQNNRGFTSLYYSIVHI